MVRIYKYEELHGLRIDGIFRRDEATEAEIVEAPTTLVAVVPALGPAFEIDGARLESARSSFRNLANRLKLR